MRYQTALITIALLVVINGFAKSKQNIHVADIKKVQKPQEPKTAADYYANLAKHKHHDVTIYQVANSAESYYQVCYYVRSADSFTLHIASFDSKYMMDKASYNWVNDTMLSLRLYNSKSEKQEKSVTVWGNWTTNRNKTTGIRED